LLNCKRELDALSTVEDIMQTVVKYASRSIGSHHSSSYVLLGTDSGDLQQIPPSSDLVQPIQRSNAIDLYERARCGEVTEGIVPLTALGRFVGALYVSTPSIVDREAYRDYLSSLAVLATEAMERVRLFTALRQIGASVNLGMELNSTLESILDDLTQNMGFEYGLISMVDDYAQEIRAVKGRNVPPGWIARSWHNMNSDDILATIVRDPRVEVFTTYDPRLDYSLWSRYQHANLARLFVPITVTEGSSPRVIGVIETGCRKEHQERILSANVDRVARMGEEAGKTGSERESDG